MWQWWWQDNDDGNDDDNDDNDNNVDNDCDNNNDDNNDDNKVDDNDVMTMIMAIYDNNDNNKQNDIKIWQYQLTLQPKPQIGRRNLPTLQGGDFIIIIEMHHRVEEERNRRK